MQREPQPFFRSARNAWYVQLGSKQIKLGVDKEQAKTAWHDLMAKRGKTSEAAEPVAIEPPTEPTKKPSTVGEVRTEFLAWCEKHRAKRSHEWYEEKTK